MPDADDPTISQDGDAVAAAAEPRADAAPEPRTPAPQVAEEGDTLQAAAQQGGATAEATSPEAPELAALRRDLMAWARGRFVAVAVGGVLLGVVIGSVITVFLVETRVRTGIRGEVARLDASLQSIESSAAATRTALARASADAGAARSELETLDGRAVDLLQRYELLAGRIAGFEQASDVRAEVSDNAILDRLDAIESLVATSDAFTPAELQALAAERHQIEEDAAYLRDALEENAGYEVLILYDDSHDAQSAEIAADLRELGFRVAESVRTREALVASAGYVREPLLGDIASLDADEKASTLARVARAVGIDASDASLLRPDAEASTGDDRRALVLFLVE